MANSDFAKFLESKGNLGALDRIIEDLTEELKDSQLIMNQIKDMINSLPKNAQDLKPDPNNCGLRHEDISYFSNDTTPNLLMSDMVENTCDVDLDVVIATMKSYAEDIKNNLVITEPDTKVSNLKKKLDDLDLEQYASSLDVLCKRLSNLKLNINDEGNHRNYDLEAKLSVLCNDVNTFTQMVQAKTTLSETNESWTPTQQPHNAHNYDQIINKLLAGINEASYLLHNKN